MTGHETAGMLEPLQVYAHVPVLMKSYGQVEQATAKSSLVGRRHRYLAELKAATMTHCEFCIDMGSQVVRQAGVLTDQELLALPHFRTSDLFDDIDRLVLEYAVAMSNTPVEVPEALFKGLREAFGDAPGRRAHSRDRAGEPSRQVQPGDGHRGQRLLGGPGLRGADGAQRRPGLTGPSSRPSLQRSWTLC